MTEPERLARWIGTWTGDPASGPVDFRMLYEGEGPATEVFTIHECEEPRRLAVTSHRALRRGDASSSGTSRST